MFFEPPHFCLLHRNITQATTAVLRLQKTVLMLETDAIEDIDSFLGIFGAKKPSCTYIYRKTVLTLIFGAEMA